MKRITHLLAALLFVASAFIGCKKCPEETNCNDLISFNQAALASSNYGWEVYSWPACGKWMYSIITATNRNKSVAEVKGTDSSSSFRPIAILWSKEHLIAALQRLPQGEPLTLFSERIWGANNTGGFQLPPVDEVNAINQAATQAGFRFTIIY